MKTILVPMDCSELSRRAVRYAGHIAARTGGKVIAVYGERFSARVEGEGVAAALVSAEDLEWMEMPIRRTMTGLLDAELPAEVERRALIADGYAADAIVDTADERGADLIVMGTHDRNRLMRAVLGSVTDTVLRESHLPVLVLREHNDPAHHEMLRLILCPFRDTAASRSAVAIASRLAAAFGAELRLVHVTSEANAELPAWLAATAPAGALQTVERMEMENSVGPKIVAMADRLPADLVVMPTSHRRFSDTGASAPPAMRVLLAAQCPVLSVTAPPST